MAISETTNSVLFSQGADIGGLLLQALAKVKPYVEKAHGLGIPLHGQTPVDGFSPGDGAVSDVMDMVTLGEEFIAFMTTTQVKRCALIRRNLA